MLDLAALLKDNSRLGMQHGLSLLIKSYWRPLARSHVRYREKKNWLHEDGNDTARRHYIGPSVSSVPLFAPGCQIILSKELEGMELKLPEFTRNFYVDGHVPQPH